jgi:hypothetical protein
MAWQRMNERKRVYIYAPPFTFIVESECSRTVVSIEMRMNIERSEKDMTILQNEKHKMLFVR